MKHCLHLLKQQSKDAAIEDRNPTCFLSRKKKHSLRERLLTNALHYMISSYEREFPWITIEKGKIISVLSPSITEKRKNKVIYPS